MARDPDGSSAAAGAAAWADAADRAGADVHARFGHRILGLPATWLGAAERPAPSPRTPWHYWWQAHYLDAVLDAGGRKLRDGGHWEPELARAGALLRGIRLRNLGTLRNAYFDDMAWLALAADRLNLFSLAATGHPHRPAVRAVATLRRQLLAAHDDVLGGGLYWSRKRDYKNTPVNGPAALFFARTGEPARAAALLNWLGTTLRDPVTGLYLDGIHPADHAVERPLYTYNQGPAVAALLALGHPQMVTDASAVIAAVDHHLTRADGTRPLVLHEGGDGNLFTGILCRYLALASRSDLLPAATRATAARLVHRSASALPPPPAGRAVLSWHLARWTIFEAAATCPPPS
ncbi:glycoside hydrolase family 76 protein [Specibacter cremeus]|uniref:glycoside hydrolase family 76 protein n=1 Tax=Specibacter cremeus TaxID=1629051 RepID=UPI000F778AC6|nr:glycoside hydrolase family 76 protein [Specibacter cremeus]